MRLRNLFRAALLLTAAVLLTLALMLAGIIGFAITEHRSAWEPPIRSISDRLTLGEEGYVFDGGPLLEEKELWAMLIDEDGRVVWSENKPKEVPKHYELTDVAAFTQWYLADYPVTVWIRDDGLLVVGSPKNSQWKYPLSFSMDTVGKTPYFLLAILLLSLSAVLILSAALLRIWFRREQTEKDQARSDWINGISHDIRTPLSLVMGYANEIEKNKELPQTTRRQAGIIRNQSQTIKELVNDLNLTMRMDYEMQPLRKIQISPAAVVRQAAADLLNGGLEDKYTLEVMLDETIQDVTLYADEVLIRRALRNLLSNCVLHNPQGCVIQIGARMQRKMCVLWVQNQTTGNDCFGKRKKTEYDSFGAHGIGLKLVQQIARVHGGHTMFWVDCGWYRCEIWMPEE